MNTARAYFSANNSLWRLLQQEIKKRWWHFGLQGAACIKQIFPHFYLYFSEGTQSTPICTFTCVAVFFFFSFFLYTEWVTPRRFHCRVNRAETPIHQTGMCVLSFLTGGMQIKKTSEVGFFWGFFFAVFGLPSKLSYHPWAVLSPTQAPRAVRGQQNPCRINTKSSNGAWGGETLHTSNKI